MRRRFLADEVQGTTASLTGQNAAHLARVLRARVGQEYELVADSVVRIGRITRIEPDRVHFDLGEEIAAVAAPTVELVIAIFKFDRFEWAVEKATELGVARIIPLIARRTDKHLVTAATKRVERWRRIAHEASQQSRRSQVPEIAEPAKLKEIASLSPGIRILLDETEREQTLRSVLETNRPSAVTLAIGPEGGWSDDELETFRNSEWISASVGANILRAETAVVSALAITGAMLS